jgi:hypothetical protein
MKLIAVMVVEIPENSKLYKIRSNPTLVNDNPDVLNGGYNVQPIPLPYSQISDNIIIRYEYGIIKTDIILILGYITSDAPKYIGTK